MVRVLIVLLLFCLSSVGVQAQNPPSLKRDAVRKLVLLSWGNQSAWYGVAEPLIEASRKVNPEAQEVVWVELSSYLRDVALRAASRPNGPIERMIDRYDQRFSEAEIRQVTDFFESDLGKRFQAESIMLELEFEKDRQRIMAAILPELMSSVATFYSKRGLKMP